MTSKRFFRSAAWRYGMAIAAVLCAIGLRMSVDRVFEDRYAFVTFYLAILLAAWLGGMGPAITACVLGWLAGFLFFRPEPSILNLPPAVMLGSLFYFIVGFTVALIAGRMHDRAISCSPFAIDWTRWNPPPVTAMSMKRISRPSAPRRTICNCSAETSCRWLRTRAPLRRRPKPT